MVSTCITDYGVYYEISIADVRTFINTYIIAHNRNQPTRISHGYSQAVFFINSLDMIFTSNPALGLLFSQM